MGETRVDLLHLLEDLRDAYPASIEETILTEVVANSLDSGAGRIGILADAAAATLTVVDDGSGMRRRELARYHDLASSTKTRGQGIGFAGVGIKLGLLTSQQVVTETRRGKSHVATIWHLASRHRAPWKWVPPSGLTGERGTAVCLKLNNPLSPLLDAGFLENTLQHNYQPLLDPRFEEFLAERYRHAIRFEVNEREIERRSWEAPERASLEVRLMRRRKPSAVGFLVRYAEVLPEERRGLAISTLGKVIKRGWDWLGISPQTPENIGGLIEVPDLAACLTLNKADFLRTGPRGATYLAYRKAIQEAVSRRLAEWGDLREAAEESRRRAMRPLERDLERVIEDLTADFPLLTSLVENRAGGQRRLPMGTGARTGESAAGLRLTVEGAEAAEPERIKTAENGKSSEKSTPPGESRVAESAAPGPDQPDDRAKSRPVRSGLRIQFEERPDDPEIGRLIESTVWVNTAHPAYRRAAASRSEGYHFALSVALALAPLAAEARKEHAFLTAFLVHWGKSIERSRRGAKKR